jgi:catechol 2,3-dioxygenase-like lactoylglutathione lyase family enzyme
MSDRAADRPPDDTTDSAVHTVRPSSPRWTHLALMVDDLDASIEWYTTYTPLAVVSKREDESGRSAWLGQPSHPDNPFFLVLAQFLPGSSPWPDIEKAVMSPFAHLGIELTSRAEVDQRATEADAAGHLTHGPVELPPPIGYVCFVTDPDGNTIEFSFDQGVFAKAHELWAERETGPTDQPG